MLVLEAWIVTFAKKSRGKRVKQECPERVSSKSVKKECQARVSRKSVEQECP